MRQSFEPNIQTTSRSSSTPKETPIKLFIEGSDSNNPFFQKEYFNDTYVIIEKVAPFRSLLLSIDRVEKVNNFSQEIKVFYFDGSTWGKDSVISNIPTNDVRANSLLKYLTEPFENKGSMSAQIKIDQQVISFSSDQLIREVTISSNGEGGQFIYQGNGLLSIDNRPIQAYVFHLREFSFDAAKIEYIIDPENATKDYTVFWDKEGSFYFSERLQNRILTNSNKEFTHAIKIDSHQIITRTESFRISKISKNDNELLKISFREDINDLIELPLLNILRSNVKGTDSLLSTGKGKVIKREGRSVTGVGFMTNY